MKREYILCAAVWFNDNKIYKGQPINIDYGYVICGARHSNCYLIYFSLVNEKLVVSTTQGFLTSLNRFVTREEAAKIAHEAKQIPKMCDALISENLY